MKVLVNYSGREINAKLVYYGPGLSGKTTNLEYIYSAIPQTHRGKMVSMKTKTERTLFFDFLPIHLGELSGFKTRFLLYTVPGQVYYNATRKLVLKGVDAVVFVADSARGKMDENVESLQNLRSNLQEHGLSLDRVPWIIQYNKRDLPDTYSVEELERVLNPRRVPSFEAVATTGQGVFDSFKAIARMLLKHLSAEIGVQVVPSTAVPGEERAPVGDVRPLGRPQSARGIPFAPPPEAAPHQSPQVAVPQDPRRAPAASLKADNAPAKIAPLWGRGMEPSEAPGVAGGESRRLEAMGERLRRWLAGPRPEEGPSHAEVPTGFEESQVAPPQFQPAGPVALEVPRRSPSGAPPEDRPWWAAERQPEWQPEPEGEIEQEKLPDETLDAESEETTGCEQPLEPLIPEEVTEERQPDTSGPFSLSLRGVSSSSATAEARYGGETVPFREVPILVDLDPEDLEAGVVLKLRIAVRQPGHYRREGRRTDQEAQAA